MNIPHDFTSWLVAVSLPVVGGIVGYGVKETAEFYNEGKSAHTIVEIHTENLGEMAEDLSAIKDSLSDVRVGVASNAATLTAMQYTPRPSADLLDQVSRELEARLRASGNNEHPNN